MRSTFYSIYRKIFILFVTADKIIAIGNTTPTKTGERRVEGPGQRVFFPLRVSRMTPLATQVSSVLLSVNIAHISEVRRSWLVFTSYIYILVVLTSTGITKTSEKLGRNQYRRVTWAGQDKHNDKQNCGCLCSPRQAAVVVVRHFYFSSHESRPSKRSQAPLRYWVGPSFPLVLVMANWSRGGIAVQGFSRRPGQIVGRAGNWRERRRFPPAPVSRHTWHLGTESAVHIFLWQRLCRAVETNINQKASHSNRTAVVHSKRGVPDPFLCSGRSKNVPRSAAGDLHPWPVSVALVVLFELPDARLLRFELRLQEVDLLSLVLVG